ncbi:cell cycle regulator of non-homologous end joining [Accipiter gentilis]|uniref:cell cycle regulator of non-homologous end joining n=1 Tax=Astur gentilis TaxID=8957 RepID=UPI0021108090|nr:cell cycle regulator of non-homologous end joining [Accipiter gentilis]
MAPGGLCRAPGGLPEAKPSAEGARRAEPRAPPGSSGRSRSAQDAVCAGRGQPSKGASQRGAGPGGGGGPPRGGAPRGRGSKGARPRPAREMAAGGRRRVLPAWMEAAGDERVVAAGTPPARAGSGGGRRLPGSAAGAGGRARPGPVRPRRLPRAVGGAAVYCMNEAELVDVALAVLAESLQRDEGAEEARCGSREEQELQATPEEAPGSTASTAGGSGRSPAPPAPAGADAGRPGWEDSEDDALRYVREIFFS